MKNKKESDTNNFDGYIPMAIWGKDHWSTLAYVETVMVESAGFQVGADARMRSNRHNFRVMQEQCPKPKRPGKLAMGITMDPKYGSRLNDGTSVDNHDDWMCVQDMAKEGLFTVGPDEMEPGVVLHFSKKGNALAEALRRHKSAGGQFAKFISSVTE
jgi:hypothetical protein